MNINRDYLIINDVKKSNIKLDNGSMFFYITDKNTQNIFVNLVINVSNNDLIQKYANIENAEDYALTMNIVKPDNTYKVIEGKLHDKENAIFEFNLSEDCCDEIGPYRCELLTKCNINGHEEITTSNKITYKVKSSILNDLDNIVEAPEYPLVIQLFDKLSDIEQYEEDRRANELARQLAEEQRQARFNVLDADMSNRIEIIDDKLVEIDNVLISKEDIADIKAKNAEQDRRLDVAENRLDNINTNIENVLQPTVQRVDAIEAINTAQNDRLDAVEAKNTQQDNRLDIAENRLANIGNDITNTMQPIIDEHTSRLDAIEAINVSQNNRLDAIEVKNQEQDDRLLDIEKVNNKQDIDIKCLYGASQTIDVTKEGNSIYLQNSNNGFVAIDEIKGNTLVNCNKEPNKELILNGNINTSADNTVTLTEGVDGGLVDVALEGNTLVNVSKTKDSTAITKAYTVENSGNHVALQGEVDGSCKPVITGKTLVNLFNETNFEKLSYADLVYWDGNIVKASSQAITSERGNFVLLRYVGSILKQGTVYTFVIRTKGKFTGSIFGNDFETQINNEGDGIHKIVFTYNGSTNESYRMWVGTSTPTNLEVEFLLLLEGDYTDKPIPDYFTGLQSTFEDNLVTQEMIDNREEEADNLGKYKVEYKVTGKNKFDKSKALDGYEIGGTSITPLANWFVTDFIPVIPNTSYKISGKNNGNSVIYYDNNKEVLAIGGGGTYIITVPKNAKYVKLNGPLIEKDTFQLEQGSTATSYEPYKGHTKTLYLNSPLLEGDTIEEKDGSIYHVHRSELVAYTEGDEVSLITDKVNALHKLAEPTYELIEQSNLAIPSYANGHLDFDTAVPISKVNFLHFEEGLTYLYPATPYTIQFISDRVTTADINLGGASLLAQNIVVGLNRISITTPDTLVDNKLIIDGAGANIREIVVTDTDREFEYFEGMKSVGECEELEVKSGNKNLFDGKWELNEAKTSKTTDFIKINNNVVTCYMPGYVKSNGARYLTAILYDENKSPIKYHALGDGSACYSFDNLGNFSYLKIMMGTTLTDCDFDVYDYKISDYMGYKGEHIPHQSTTQTLTHEPLRAVGDAKDRYVLIDGKWYIERNCGSATFNGSDDENWELDNQNGDNGDISDCGGYRIVVDDIISIPDGFATDDRNAGAKLKCNLFACIPTYNIKLKGINYGWGKFIFIKFDKSVDRNEFINYLKANPVKVIYPLATPVYEQINYNPLEVYSDITHISNNSTIPCNMTIKNTGYNCLLKPSTTYTISSNLGLNTVTTPSTLTEDCLRFMDTDTSDVTTMRDVLVLEGDWTTKADLIPTNFSGIESTFEQELVTDTEDEHYGKYKVNVRVTNENVTAENNMALYINEPLRGIGSVKDKIYVKDNKVVVERKCGARAYQDGDFGTYPTDKVNTVYPLAEPIYEEVEYNGVKLSIEIFKNSTLSYNSNVPVTSTVHYSYSVPIVDKVAQTASISDQQDSMIIDLATQVAVMEMMLM